MSELLQITASIVQGSAIGPVSYVVTAADLTTTVPGNSMCKYADDTYVIVPAYNVDTRSSEVNNVEAWAEANNLTLNRKSLWKLSLPPNANDSSYLHRCSPALHA